MKIFLTKKLSKAVSEQPKEYVRMFISKINAIKDLSITEFLALDSVFELAHKDNMELHAYEIDKSLFVVFSYVKPKQVYLVDIMKVDNEGELISLVYPKKDPAEDMPLAAKG